MKELTQSQTILHKKEPIHYLNGFEVTPKSWTV